MNERLVELHLGAIEERIEAELALGRHRALVEALVAEHPLRERLRVQLLWSLYRSGRQADALAAFRDGRFLLVEAIGVEPGPELRDLHAAILRQEPALSAFGPAELARELASRPVLVVAVTGDGGLSDRLRGAEHVALGALGREAIAAIAAPDEAEVPVADLADCSGGVPQRAHRLAAESARAQAARRLSPVADRAAAERSVVCRTERQLAGNVAESQAVSQRAALHQADRATLVCPFKNARSPIRRA